VVLLVVVRSPTLIELRETNPVQTPLVQTCGVPVAPLRLLKFNERELLVALKQT
jgi:hypothetical protein